MKKGWLKRYIIFMGTYIGMYVFICAVDLLFFFRINTELAAIFSMGIAVFWKIEGLEKEK